MRAIDKTEAMTGHPLEVFGEGNSPMDNWACTDVLKQERVPRRRISTFAAQLGILHSHV